MHLSGKSELFGRPSTETTELLNQWEDDSIGFLHPAVITPRRALLADETAYHAGLYARLRASREPDQSDNAFERRFAEILEERLRLGSAPSNGYVKEAGEGVPSLQHVIHGLGHVVVTGQSGALPAHPGFEVINQRLDVPLAVAYSPAPVQTTVFAPVLITSDHAGAR